MKAKPVRVILAFYSAEDGEPKKAFEEVSTKSRSATLITSEDSVPKRAERYAELRLPGEKLLFAEVDPERVEPILKRLEGTGSPAVFVFRPDVENPSGADQETGARTEGPAGSEDWARLCAERRNRLDKSKLDIFARLDNNEVVLDAARADLAEAARLGHSLTAAAEWILDNGYLIRLQRQEIRRDLPRGYAKILPTLAPGYDLARELVAQTENSVHEANITGSLRSYQQVAPLSIVELWLFPLLLRMALIEALCQLGVRVNRAQQFREAAYLWANRLAAAARSDDKEVGRVLELLENEPIALEPYFVTCLVEQLQDEESALAPVRHWIEERLKTTVMDLVRREHTQEATERLLTANAFGSLRTLSRIDFTEVFEAVSLVEAQLRTDSAYALSDFTTRDQCRRVVERISRCSGMSELEVANKAVDLAARAEDVSERHAAYFLLADGVTQLESATKSRVPFRIRFIRTLRSHATIEYQGGVIALTACFIGVALALAWEAGVRESPMLTLLGFLALFPLSELAIQILNALVISLLPPEPLPKMDFEKGIPPEHATLVVVPMMLSSCEVVGRELDKLEVRFLANRGPNIYFALLADFLDATAQSTPEDQQLLNAAREGIVTLNSRYPGGCFLLFHRERVWSQSEGMWIGWERKRGKIEELNRFLTGSGSERLLSEGNVPLPIRYVITLDADTQLPPGTARRMVETLAHPLNRVEIDPATRVRKQGYTIIQPRVSIALPDANATRFTRLFADTSGTDPYCRTVSDANQDLFGEGIFHGKAIYDVRAFQNILENRFPAETLLSHDLIEGAHVGVGLATDIELFENLPLDYVSFSKRQHRWIRGDWQIAPWALPHVPTPKGRRATNTLSLMNRWRILDNLRRSLVPLASLLLLLFGWTVSAAPGVWSLVVGLAIAIPALAPLLDRLARKIQGSVHGWHGAADELMRAIVMVAFLPHQAWLSTDAIVRTIYRRRITRRNLLEWQTAETAGVDAKRHVPSTLRQMIIIGVLSIVIMIVLRVEGAFAPGSIFLALWTVSPAILRWLSGTSVPRRNEHISRANELFLRNSARRTWRFFDDLVGPDRNWLPPDNTQLALRIEVAERTSPTNIGLWLASAISAVEFGYLTADDFLNRCEQTLVTVSKLECYEGHLLNWYDIKTCQPLTPRYVSTVDSGNLIAALWVLERACQEQLESPLLGPACIKGLADTLSILREICGPEPSLEIPLQALRRQFRGAANGMPLIGQLRAALNPIQQLRDARRWQKPDDERSYWISRLAGEIAAWTQVVDRYLGWMETLNQPPDSFLRAIALEAVKLRRQALSEGPSLATLAKGAPSAIHEFISWGMKSGLSHEASAWLNQLAAEYQRARSAAQETVKRMENLSAAAARFSDGINMGFLYDTDRRLFGVGYAVGGPVEFGSHYDLLASECRLASLVAIAKGNVPV